MSEPPRTASLPRHQRLKESVRQTTSMSLPLAVHFRLDRLARSADDVNTSRAEIVAMLIAEAELDPAELERRILLYRKKFVRDVIPETDQGSDADEVVIPLGQPGRPKKAQPPDQAGAA